MGINGDRWVALHVSQTRLKRVAGDENRNIGATAVPCRRRPNRLTVAYVAFAFLVVMTLVGAWFTHQLFRSRCYSSVQLGCRTIKIYYFVAASSILFIYFALGITFLVLAIIYGQMWAEWSWRWSVLGALLDSLFVIKSTKKVQNLQQAVYLQAIVAAIEIVLVIASPAIPNPSASRYLTVGIIFFHVLWTSLSSWYWLSRRSRVVRWIASAGQGIAALALIWGELGFVVLFCPFSLLVYIVEAIESQQSFWRVGSIHRRPSPEPIQPSLPAADGKKYNVVFFGMDTQRTDLLRRVLNWSTASVEIGFVSLYNHPTMNDVAIASVSPRAFGHAKEKETYIRNIIKIAASIVLVYDPSNYESLEYIRSLRGFTEEQPVLLVSCLGLHQESIVPEGDARELARQEKWRFTTADEIDGAFNDLLTCMFARPRPRAICSLSPRSRFVV
ncbi:hypothetical protein O1611_g4589 [Lasiodiplodia mahajangana]|uniref:Uncharacterized protein n=1 Tax=Lasiodiplodia mahajangana TaxID=1108764 RepID=A0ACC2JP68_9PEZI|nr:hypothetical protein O1611_g4589 [Lasiodiplodia mahajangana]